MFKSSNHICRNIKTFPQNPQTRLCPFDTTFKCELVLTQYLQDWSCKDGFEIAYTIFE